jgi:PAS domain S-box-containing protein
LAQWIAARGTAQLINDLDADPRFEAHADPTAGPRSLLAQPLAAGDGTLLAILVLMDRRARPFGRRDLDRLAGLLAAGARALEQAGLLARTDRALARRAAQLAAIQRTGRDLNSMLDPARIVRLALDCALEITGAEAGLAAAANTAGPVIWQTRGGTLAEAAVRPLVTAAFQRPAQDPGPDLPAAGLFPGTQARLVAPIRRRERTFGILVAESRHAAAFDGQDLLALAALADQAATALENTRLFGEIARERGRLDRIIRTMADGLLTLDAERRILSVNPAAEALTGRPAQEAVGQHACAVLGCRLEGACDAGCPLARAAGAGQVVRQDRFLARTAAGADRVFALSAASTAGGEGESDGLVVLLQDVTARDEIERFQRELVGAISHEIRAPLANINAVADLLLADDETGGAAREGLATIRIQGRRLADFAERMLDVSRLEAGSWQLEPRPLPVTLLAEAAVREWRAAQPGRPFRLDLPPAPLWAWADEQAAAVVLDSLIENAVKYSPPETEITVAATPGPGEEVSISVIDQGPGMAREQQARIFERFYRGDGSDAQRVYGHGLGLYVARGLVVAMGGRLGVTSEPGRGSRFTFTLPTQDAAGEGTISGHG